MLRNTLRWSLAGKIILLSVSATIVLLTYEYLSKTKSPQYSGEVIENFSLMDQTGRLFELARQKSIKALVFYSYGIGCPITRKNIPILKEIQRQFAGQGVDFYLIDANPQDKREDLIQEAERYEIQMPILMDESQIVSTALNIQRTGEAILVDVPSWKIIFRGPIDDRLGYDYSAPEAQKHFLRDAVSARLNNEPIDTPQIPVVGCAISFEKYPEVNYHGDIAPIIRAKCSSCHSEGQISPTNLWTYQDLKGWSAMLQEVIKTEKMPPWEVDTFYTSVKEDYALSAVEKAKIIQWINAGHPSGPEGGPISADLPGSPFIPHLTYKIPHTIEFGAHQESSMYYEPIIENAKEDIWFSQYSVDLMSWNGAQHVALVIKDSALDLSKGKFFKEMHDLSNVHNIIWFNSKKRVIHDLELKNIAYRIPKGSYVYLRFHFSPSGKKETQSATLFLNRLPPGNYREVTLNRLIVKNFEIPANAERNVIRARRTLDQDVYLVKIGTHMHWRGHYSKLFSIDSTGHRKLLYSARYLGEKTRHYQLKEPIFLKKGVVLEAEFEHDNSINNPAPIKYSQIVKSGLDLVENEMASMFVYWYSAP